MFGTDTRNLPTCDVIAVDKAQYRVTATIQGETPKAFFTELISAGSAAHAALLAGVLLEARVRALVTNTMEQLNYMHNITDHLSVVVTKV